MTNITKFLVFFITFISASFLSVFSQSIVKTLPGYSGNLPFKLETGYISVGESEEIELFYYFVESERNPKEDPLLIWLIGGPGCSGLSGLAIEIGPFAFDASSFNGSLPTLIPRQHSWTKIASVLFIDSPVGTGFSYATRANSYYTSDTLSANHTVTFLRKWLLNHPAFIRNDLYIAGDSYGGKIVPIVALEILNSNEAGVEPQMSLQGYLVGNPVTDLDNDKNERIPYAHGMGLIPNEYYELAKRSCAEKYVNPDPNNLQCLRALELINSCLRGISDLHILEAKCPSQTDDSNRGVKLLEDDWFGVNLLSFKREEIICIDDMNNMITSVWANNPQVQDALHVRKGKTKNWKRCKPYLEGHYAEDLVSVFPYHQVISQKISKALVYSGDHDITIPYISTLKWIQRLNLTLDDRWRPWNVNGQIAGFVIFIRIHAGIQDEGFFSDFCNSKENRFRKKKSGPIDFGRSPNKACSEIRPIRHIYHFPNGEEIRQIATNKESRASNRFRKKKSGRPIDFGRSPNKACSEIRSIRQIYHSPNGGKSGRSRPTGNREHPTPKSKVQTLLVRSTLEGQSIQSLAAGPPLVDSGF